MVRTRHPILSPSIPLTNTQGCCQSTTSTDESASPNARSPHHAAADSALPRDSSRAAINQPSRSLSNVDSPRTSATSHPAPPKPAPGTRPNVPVRAPSPVEKSPQNFSNVPPPWTRAQLQREREAFFDTRISGRQEVWDALKMVCDLLQKGEVEQAQGIMDAVGLSCPNGRVATGKGRDKVKGGVYDERGVSYELPAWVVQDPEDVLEDSEDEKTAEDGGVGEDGSSEIKREEKGKGRAADLGEIITLRARLSDRGADVSVQVGMKEKVAAAVRKIQERIGPRRVRLAYLGHVLLESKTLEEQGYQPRNVVNAFVFDGDEGMFKK